MALNASSHNAAGVKTGPTSGPPPEASEDTLAAIASASSSDPLGQHAGGQDGGDKAAPKKVKTEKELDKERKKAEKEQKFLEKKAKQAAAGAPGGVSKNKEKKAKAEAAKDAPLPEYVEETKPGDKKILKPLDDEFHKAYVPRVVESSWYDWWEKEGYFKPQLTADGNVKEEGMFEIPIPPPNVTGELHMGHALTNALQDTMIRWNRMHGKSTLWLPGCDHAGIATQTVVENTLWRKHGKTRHDLGRAKFIETVWDWKGEYHAKINNAVKRMGSSVDWTREAFTMDANLSAAVQETFVRLHEEGVIYRANRLVNWCTKLNTAISNLEVNNKELTGRTLLDVPGYERKVEFGVITHFKYPIDGSDETIEVATTRPETMLGDSGIAVHPKDERYKHLVGKEASHPFLDRKLPIFADEYVDMEFGTGAVKITPAHDPNDFNLGTSHNLQFINILTDDGLLNHNTGSFQGMKRFDARYEVTKQLREKGLFVRAEDNPMKVPICDRSKDVIEPLIKPQWYMSMKSMADDAAKAVRAGEIKFRPESAEKSFLRWMDGIQDWCLSRQLWGHQIPAYFCTLDGEPGDESDGERWVTGRTEAEAEEKAKAKFPGKKVSLKRDEDVLDTWFSSGLWPFSTLGWPNKTDDLRRFYPTSVLETGWDIIFFWVARMVIFGLKLTGQVPFREVYCHPLIRDSEGRKMSKSLGNVISPLDVMEGIELQTLHDKLKLGNLDPKEMNAATKFQKSSFPDGIPECGADALRFCLVNYTTGGAGDVSFDIKVMHAYRRFCNKIYQASKFVLGKLDNDFVPAPTSEPSGSESLAEKWILHKLTNAAKDINTALADREFSVATSIAYQYWYSQLCDVFIENSKSIINDGNPSEQTSAKNTLYTAIEGALTMIHPFMPFLSEEMWQRLPRRPDDKTPSIVIAKYPVYQPSMDDPAAEKAYELVLDVAKAARSLTAEYAIKENGALHVQLFNPTAHATCKAQLPSIRTLAGKAVSTIELLAAEDEKPAGCVPAAVSADATVFLVVKGRVDLDQEIQKAMKKRDKAAEVVKKQRKILGDEAYTSKVSEELQEVERRKLRDAEKEVEEMDGGIAAFERLKLE